MPHRPSPVRPAAPARPASRCRLAALALALAALLVAGALPAAALTAAAVDPASPVVVTVNEGVDRSAGSAEICLDDWHGAQLYRWDSSGSAWVFTHNLPHLGQGCHVVEWDLGTAEPGHAGRYVATSDPSTLPWHADDPGVFDVVVRLAPAEVTASPDDAVVTAGEPARFAAGARVNAGPPARAQWQTSRDGVVWADAAGATSGTWAMPTASEDDGLLVRAVYSRVPWNAFQIAPEPVATDPARLTVWTGVGLERDPVDVVADAGDEVTFDVGQVWGVAPVSLQWERRLPDGDWEPLPDATGASLTMTAGTDPAVDGARFRLCHANDFSARACSGDALLTVYPAPAPPEVTADPASVRALPGEPVGFMAEATGADTVRWERRAPGSADWEPVAGAVTARLEITAAEALDGAEHRAVFGNGVGETATRAATLTLVVLPPVDVTVTPSAALVARLPGW